MLSGHITVSHNCFTPADSSSERFIAELLAEEEAAAKQKEKKQAKAAKKKVGGWVGGWVGGSRGTPVLGLQTSVVAIPDMVLQLLSAFRLESLGFLLHRGGKKSPLTTENDRGSIRDCGRQRFPAALTCRCCAVLYCTLLQKKGGSGAPSEHPSAASAATSEAAGGSDDEGAPEVRAAGHAEGQQQSVCGVGW